MRYDRDDVARELEYRKERHGVAKFPGSVLHPNGTLMTCADPDVTGALLRAVIAMHGEAA